MFKPQWKKRLISFLVLCFGIQTVLVYSDARSVPLTEAALQGRVLWHQHACQTCHQLYGQGGFLGPDLTNVSSRIDSTRFASLLQVGSGQMPPLRLNDLEVAAISEFLRHMDQPEIGRGQLRLGNPEAQSGLQGAFERALEAKWEEGNFEAQVGFQAMQARPCSACHLPFRESPVGAPDLSLVFETLTRDSLEQVLSQGRPERGMPPPVPGLSLEERESVIAFLEFLNAHRSEIESVTQTLASDRSLELGALPWWEYR